MKVTIKRISVKEVEGQFGKSNKYGIQTAEHGDKWLSCFENKFNGKELQALKEGAEANIIVSQKGDFLNFRTANATDKLEERVKILEAIVLSKDSNAQVAPVVSVPPPIAEDDDNNW
jgi:hypothetical protein